ncbi:LOW QUALITY PROTEIN: defensin-like protein 195 [Eutrema salsugineum]|uniref:LOW QUALITY PROTEIN: defensin-like protein 195 n=1 Tax=Eutrema salsugineum TaxID=72664 RepID=UPI000CECF6D3|nr:LOW QUALITY PROTEIN: defensin-like protein 195 [Eutrema salsugineum]
MAKAMKPVSIFVFFFIFFLVISEVPEIEAQDYSECLKEYGGDVGFGFCAPRIFPTFCYTRCRENKGAKGGRCLWGEGIDVKCLCDFCNDQPIVTI